MNTVIFVELFFNWTGSVKNKFCKKNTTEQKVASFHVYSRKIITSSATMTASVVFQLQIVTKLVFHMISTILIFYSDLKYVRGDSSAQALKGFTES